MSKKLRSGALPPIPEGPITGQALRTILTQWQTLQLAEVDIRDAGSEAAVTLAATIDPLPKVDEPATIVEPWTFGDLYAGSFDVTGAVAAASVAATGAVAGATVAATGAVTGASVAATGALTGASATVTGTVSAGNVALTAATVGSTVGAAGAASALPANPTGYISISINGTLRKLPYYAV